MSEFGGWGDEADDVNPFGVDDNGDNDDKKSEFYKPVQSTKGSTRGFKRLEVQLDKKVYGPGDRVKGQLLIQPKSKLKACNIRVKFIGTASAKCRSAAGNINKTINQFYEVQRLFPSRASPAGLASGKTAEKKVLTAEKKKKGKQGHEEVGKGAMAAQLHALDLEYQLPAGLASTITGKGGRIGYMVQVFVEAGLKEPDPVLTAHVVVDDSEVDVNAVENLAATPRLHENVLLRGWFCCSAGSLDLGAMVHCRAALAGETILVSAVLKNLTKKPPGPVVARLVRTSVYTGARPGATATITTELSHDYHQELMAITYCDGADTKNKKNKKAKKKRGKLLTKPSLHWACRYLIPADCTATMDAHQAAKGLSKGLVSCRYHIDVNLMDASGKNSLVQVRVPFLLGSRRLARRVPLVIDEEMMRWLGVNEPSEASGKDEEKQKMNRAADSEAFGTTADTADTPRELFSGEEPPKTIDIETSGDQPDDPWADHAGW